MVELSAERGYEGVTVRGLTRLAGVSTRSFYKHFANAEECFAHTYDWLVQDALRRAYAARNGSVEPEAAIRSSLRALSEDLVRNPKASRLVLIEAFAAGPAMRTRMREAIGGFERLLIDSLPDVQEAPSQVIGGIAAASMRVARTRVLAGDGAELGPLPGALADWILSLSGRHAPAESPDRDPFDLAARNGDAREEPGAQILGRVGEERGRILSAVLKLASAGGVSNLRIPRIRAEAGVSRRSFDARFADAGECFLEAIEALAVSAAARAQSQASGSADWERRVYRGLRALCAEVAHNPALAHLAFVDIYAPGRDGLERREQLISFAAERLRMAIPSEHRPSELVAEASAAAGWRITQAEVAAGRAKDLPRLLPLLTYVVLAPVIGPVTAAEAIRAEELQAQY